MSSNSSTTTVLAGSGQHMPLVGLGTWRSDVGQVEKAVAKALDVGYRHIDCALVYGNEKEIGAALKAKIDGDKLKREDVFITSKLWNTYHSKDNVKKGINETLSNLGLDYLDLYIIHWPMGFKEGEGLFPTQEDGSPIDSGVKFTESWKAMEELVKEGKVKNIGVSNFNIEQIKEIQAIASVPISVNQVECHPYLNQEKLRSFCNENNIVITAYSPLGSPDRPWAQENEPKLMDDDRLTAIATKYGKTVPQVLIRFQVDRGIVVIPKSVTPSRIESNFDVFDFKLSDEDLNTIRSFNRDFRFCAFKNATNHPLHPFLNDGTSF